MSKRWKVKLKSDVVRASMAGAKVSQNALARMIPVSSGYMSQLMDGSRSPSWHVPRRFLYILGGLKFEDLFQYIDCKKG